MDAQLRTLIDLQALDARIAGLESELARLPREIAAVQAAVDETRKAVEAAKARLEAARKSQRAKEKDLEDNRIKRQKYEGQLYQVKTNKEYSAVLSEIGTLLELKGENPFRTQAYHTAARALDQFDGDLEQVIRDDQLLTIPGIGATLRDKITTLATTGSLPFYEELKAGTPPGLIVRPEVWFQPLKFISETDQEPSPLTDSTYAT